MHALVLPELQWRSWDATSEPRCSRRGLGSSARPLHHSVRCGTDCGHAHRGSADPRIRGRWRASPRASLRPAVTITGEDLFVGSAIPELEHAP